jgi:hypothetical protein
MSDYSGAKAQLQRRKRAALAAQTRSGSDEIGEFENRGDAARAVGLGGVRWFSMKKAAQAVRRTDVRPGKQRRPSVPWHCEEEAHPVSATRLMKPNKRGWKPELWIVLSVFRSKAYQSWAPPDRGLPDVFEAKLVFSDQKRDWGLSAEAGFWDWGSLERGSRSRPFSDFE